MQENKEEKTLAAFDFDGTLTTKDTLFQFLFFCFGSTSFLIGLFKFSPIFIQYLIGLKTNSEAKEKLFALFFKGIPFVEFQKLSVSFKPKIAQMINPAALDRVNWHKNKGHRLIIISASVETWIEPWALDNGFEAILATKAEVENGKLTGKFQTKNCFGPEKVNRLKEFLPDRADYVLYAYGDSSGDAELLKEAEKPYFKKFTD